MEEIVEMLSPLQKSFKELGSSMDNVIIKNNHFLTTEKFDFAEAEKELLSTMAETRLVNFMDECHLRTKEMGDSEKCEYCKLRFRCYTEATNNRRQDAKSETYAAIYGQYDTSVTRPSKPKKRGKRG